MGNLKDMDREARLVLVELSTPLKWVSTEYIESHEGTAGFTQMDNIASMHEWLNNKEPVYMCQTEGREVSIRAISGEGCSWWFPSWYFRINVEIDKVTGRRK